VGDRAGGRVTDCRTVTPNASTSAYPPALATAKTGVRGSTTIVTVLGQDLLTVADWTCWIRSTRAATAAAFTRMSGSPGWIRAARSTSARDTSGPVPVT